MAMSKILVLLVASAVPVSGGSISQSFLKDKLVPAINNLIATYPPNDRQDVLESQAPFPLNGGFLRLAFHDCAGAGGCDGCVGLALAENKGLDFPVKALDKLYMQMKLKSDYGMSRADLWALAGIVVVGNRMKVNAPYGWVLPNKLNPAYFKYGRKDCSTTPISYTDESSNFPSAFLGSSGVANYFSARFGYDNQQTVAIMGAHHVGRMHQRNSGFKGAWIPEETMDGEYYSLFLTEPDWHQEVVNCSVEPINQKVSWESMSGFPLGGGHSGQDPQPTSLADCDECKEYYYLDADIAIFKDIGTPEFNGAVECNFYNCPYAVGLSEFVKQYAANGQLWQQDFATVFDIMLSVCTRQSSGYPNWCYLTQVVSSVKRSADVDGASGDEVSSTGNAALYGLLAIPAVVLVAAGVAFGIYRRRAGALVELQDITEMPNEARQNPTPADNLESISTVSLPSKE